MVTTSIARSKAGSCVNSSSVTLEIKCILTQTHAHTKAKPKGQRSHGSKRKSRRSSKSSIGSSVSNWFSRTRSNTRSRKSKRSGEEVEKRHSKKLRLKSIPKKKKQSPWRNSSGEPTDDDAVIDRLMSDVGEEEVAYELLEGGRVAKQRSTAAGGKLKGALRKGVIQVSGVRRCGYFCLTTRLS